VADPVKQAKSAVHRAQNDRQEKASAWWQQAVNEGRVLRQARVEMTAGERQTPQQETQQRSGRSPRSLRQ